MEIFRNIAMFSLKSLLYSGGITVIGLVLSWILYRYVVIRTISIKEALFEEDNFAAWLEFVGAFPLPIFYLSAKAIEADTGMAFIRDFAFGAAYVVIFTLMFTVLRILCGWVVYFISGSDASGKINLYNEVYGQKNTAAALFSVSFALVFVNMVTNLNFGGGEELSTTALRAVEILGLTLVFNVVFAFTMRKNSLLKEIFEDNNTAGGVVFLGFTIATQLLLNTAVNYKPDFMDLDIIILACIGFVILLLTVFLSRWAFTKVLRVKMLEELYVQNNVGAALGELALYTGVALVISHFLGV